jgi:uncharacterized protein
MAHQVLTSSDNELNFALSSSSSSTPNRDECFALVTGASSGIGRAIAEELAKRKINLVLVALPASGLEGVSEHLAKTFNVDVYSFSVDLTIPEVPFMLFQECENEGLNIQILVNNVGIGNLELFETSDLDETMLLLSLNNRALVTLTYLFIPTLKKAAQSYILNVGSLASVFTIPYKAVYSATKSFLYSFSAALKLELKPSNISVSCLCPGSTLTSQRVRDIVRRTSGKNQLFIQQPDAVAKSAVQHLFAKQFQIVPGFHNRVLLAIARILPTFIIEKILVGMFKPKRENSMIEGSAVRRDVQIGVVGSNRRYASRCKAKSFMRLPQFAIVPQQHQLINQKIGRKLFFFHGLPSSGEI